jgi:low temperature requirement protein LtrA
VAIGRGEELLRHWEIPQRSTFLELFFDLVYVFALTRVSRRLIDEFAGGRQSVLPEIGQTVLLLALWSFWSVIAWSTSRYDHQHR